MNGYDSSAFGLRSSETEPVQTPDISVIIVSYNVCALLRRCLRSVEAAIQAAGLRGEILVVENASHDGSRAMLEQEWDERVRLIVNQQNCGFTRGNNQAIRQARGRYVLLLNPDTEVEPETFGTLIRYMDTHPAVGVVGPCLRYGDGSLQSSRRRFPTLASGMIESTVLQRWLGNSQAVRDFYYADQPTDHEHEVDWLVGACMLVRQAAIEQVGVLDERFFMYSEELDWCRRIKQAGWRIVYLPQAAVVHHEGQSSAQNVLARHVHFSNSKLKYFASYHGRWVAAWLRCWLLLHFVFLLYEDAAKYVVSPRKRTLRRARLRDLGLVCRWFITGRTGRKALDQLL